MHFSVFFFGANRAPIVGQPPQGMLLRVVPTGTVIAFAGNEIPTGWVECNGQALQVSEHPVLAATLKRAFWDGRSKTFSVPNIRGKFPLGAGLGEGLTDRAIAYEMGHETRLLTVAEMPSHNHRVIDPGHSHAQNVSSQESPEHKKYGGIREDMDADISDIKKNGYAPYTQGISTNGSKTGISIANKGSGAPHSIMPPFVVLRYMIKY